MNCYEYDIYYSWDGRDHSNPFGVEKTAHQIEDALRSFHGELAQRLADPDALTAITSVDEGTTSVRLEVKTVLPRADVEAALVVTLRDWDLRGTPLGV